jgi:uncharacterized protein (TIGR03435 family)
MLRTALGERFGMKVHWEKCDIPAYALLPGKHGTKLQCAGDPEQRKRRALETSMGTIQSTSIGRPGEYFASGDSRH